MDSAAKKQAYWLLKEVDHAIRNYQMIKDGDRVAVAVSGGKDSLALLSLLDFRKQFTRERYELVAIHINADGRGGNHPLHEPLLNWLRENRYEVCIRSIDLGSEERLPIGCHHCTWNRRRALFEAAVQMGCCSVAFGHHADDLAQTTLLNLFYHGRVETMEPVREYFGGVIKLIRPLCFIPEKDLCRFSKASNFPAPPSNCPQSNHSKRYFVRELIQKAEKECKDVKVNLLKAGLRG